MKCPDVGAANCATGGMFGVRGRVDQRSYPLWPPPDPDVPDYGIRLLGSLDSLRFQRTVHNLDLRKRIVLQEISEPIPTDVTPLRAAA